MKGHKCSSGWRDSLVLLQFKMNSLYITLIFFFNMFYVMLLG